MRLKRFSARSLRDAMDQVRTSLGDEAIILATEESANGEVCITAALDDITPISDLVPDHATSPSEPAPADPARLLQDMRAHLEGHGFPAQLANQMTANIPGHRSTDLTDLTAAALEKHFVFSSLDTLAGRDRFFLVGLPGAGKSAVAAKLAASARLEKRACTIVTLDSKKSGALAQMTAFSQVLGAQLEVAHSLEEVLSCASAMPDDCRLIVDDAGSNPFLPNGSSDQQGILKSAGFRQALVLAAGGDPIDSLEIAAAYAARGAREVIVTKRDLTKRLGGALGAVKTAGLSLTGMTASPHISDAILQLDARRLASQLDRSEPLSSFSASAESPLDRISQWKQ